MGVTYGIVTFPTAGSRSIRWTIPATWLTPSLLVIGVSLSFLYASDGGASHMATTIASSTLRKVSNVGSSEERTVPVTGGSTSTKILLELGLKTSRISLTGRELTPTFRV